MTPLTGDHMKTIITLNRITENVSTQLELYNKLIFRRFNAEMLHIIPLNS